MHDIGDDDEPFQTAWHGLPSEFEPIGAEAGGSCAARAGRSGRGGTGIFGDRSGGGLLAAPRSAEASSAGAPASAVGFASRSHAGTRARQNKHARRRTMGG